MADGKHQTRKYHKYVKVGRKLELRKKEQWKMNLYMFTAMLIVSLNRKNIMSYYT